ncbi:MAG: metal ABC transporter substrate-binding protein [Anaerolineae bacterium]|nr:metal ABC transporter substrate-binding protein [Anaerolineae bacterium]
MKKLFIVFILLFLLAGCTDILNVWKTKDKIRAVATTTFIADFLKNIAGDHLEVNVIMKEGSNHHAFEPTIRDARIIGTSDIIFINGMSLEGEWLGQMLISIDSEDKVVVTAEGIQSRPLVHTDHVHADGDPHVWHSTINAQMVVDNITRGLVAYDPDNRAFYEANAEAYNAQLDELTEQVEAILAVVPTERRKLVTSHEAFGYFADQFGFEVIGTIIIATQSQEPDRRQMQSIIERIAYFEVPAIFTETTMNSRLAEQIANETGVQLVPNLYSDSLGTLGTEGDTYIKMMLYNARTIAAGLS